MVRMIRLKNIIVWDHIHVIQAERVKIFDLFGQIIFSDNEARERGKGLYRVRTTGNGEQWERERGQR